jgi:hypothetical protein
MLAAGSRQPGPCWRIRYVTAPARKGRVIVRLKEQVLYGLHDPARYLTPGVIADFTGVRLRQVERDVVQVTVGSRAGWIGEAQFVPRDLIRPSVTVETVRA